MGLGLGLGWMQGTRGALSVAGEARAQLRDAQGLGQSRRGRGEDGSARHICLDFRALFEEGTSATQEGEGKGARRQGQLWLRCRWFHPK